MLEFLVKDSGDELVLCVDDCNDIISVLIFFSLSDLFPLPDVQIAGNLRQEDTEGQHNDSPCVVDDIPDAWHLSLDPSEFACQFETHSFEVRV